MTDKSLQKKAKHEVVRYSCDQCEHVATQVIDLKRHIEMKHEGVRYPCDQCEYSAADQSTLRRHKKFKREEVKYSCDQYVATKVSLLKHTHSTVPTVATKVKNVRVMIEKLDARKYQISQDLWSKFVSEVIYRQ